VRARTEGRQGVDDKPQHPRGREGRRPTEDLVAAIGEDAYYLFLSAVEIAMLLLIVGYAWTWPRQSS
jgi:hypothetical protein